ncbi:cyclic AMP response element-binding protein A isoform X2 [Nilaparvata lugens]|uniref:cyclic AMP response element-binding protein A isoform X2 n=1 Tax=Nilaparvata lugens TaxID=108931 RepID=UPI00193CE0A3|nr:cyclic AMP response element-binding protein A isoform X2 [Nilaparvata lugens]
MWKMDCFSVDKSFYDIAASDLKELWETDLDGPMVTDVLNDDDWQEEVKPVVVLHDRLMTDAALGTAPIKVEHSYCSLDSSDPHSPLASLEDEECFPSLTSAKRRCSRDQSPSPPSPCPSANPPSPIVVIKDEPMTDEEDSMDSSCPASPEPQQSFSPPPVNHFRFAKSGQSLLKQRTQVLQLNTSLLSPKNHAIIQTMNIKVESGTSGFSLPPTPPSSTSSDSEGGNVSPTHPSSPTRKLFHSVTHSTTTSRQPIQTPLISSQPKGSTGILMLTDEEKRTLLAEGYPIPTRLPLTKSEEKSLKKIRRKIKNKISAQESRRKKKEYMDALERKVEILATENSEFRKKITTLEDNNTSLLSQLNNLKALLSRSNSQSLARSLHK